MRCYGSAEFAFSGMVDLATQEGAEISIPIAAYAEPSGKVEDTAFDLICSAICNDVAKGCDAVLLDLHGAMVTQSCFDGEGELLKRIRKIDPEVPIAVALDFHTNLTEDMVNHATIIDGYRTYPHVDMYDTGLRAAESLLRMVGSVRKSKISWRTLPMMTHMIKQTPAKQPMKDVMDLAVGSVNHNEILNASVFGGFPLADIPHVSLSAAIVEYQDSDRGEKVLDQISELAWQRRSEFVFEPEPLTESIATAAQLKEYPVVIADHGDNCGAGGSADDLTVLDEMLKQGLEDIIAGPLWDPEAVDCLVGLA